LDTKAVPMKKIIKIICIVLLKYVHSYLVLFPSLNCATFLFIKGFSIVCCGSRTYLSHLGLLSSFIHPLSGILKNTVIWKLGHLLSSGERGGRS
jgi:hypothetical protein